MVSSQKQLWQPNPQEKTFDHFLHTHALKHETLMYRTDYLHIPAAEQVGRETGRTYPGLSVCLSGRLTAEMHQ